MAKKKSKLHKLPDSYKRQTMSALERSMRPLNGDQDWGSSVKYYGSFDNENESKVEGNRHG